MSLGVYYTEDFCSPSVQPTWTAVNTGLGGLDCREFALDPFEPLTRQYVFVNTGQTVYRRDNGGSWAAILTPADVAAMLPEGPCTVSGFCVDHTVPGRLWATVGSPGVVYGPGFYSAISNDYGDTWEITGLIYAGLWTYGLSSIRACGNNAWIIGEIGIGAQTRVGYSSDLGVTWGLVSVYILNTGGSMCQNPLLPNIIYVRRGLYSSFDGDFATVTSGGVVSNLFDDIGPERWDCMWFDPLDANHQRMFIRGKMYVTTNAWASLNTPATIAPVAYSFSPFGGKDHDQMIVGATLGDHVVGALYGENDITVTGIAGTNCATAPYTDAIPKTCGGACTGGVQALPYGEVFTNGVSLE